MGHYLKYLCNLFQHVFEYQYQHLKLHGADTEPDKFSVNMISTDSFLIVAVFKFHACQAKSRTFYSRRLYPLLVFELVALSRQKVSNWEKELVCEKMYHRKN